MLAEDVRELENEKKRLAEENKELRILLGDEPPKPMNCGCCAHFIQHYIEIGIGRYMETYSGHCVHGRIATKKPDGKTCRYFKAGSRKRY